MHISLHNLNNMSITKPKRVKGMDGRIFYCSTYTFKTDNEEVSIDLFSETRKPLVTIKEKQNG